MPRPWQQQFWCRRSRPNSTSKTKTRTACAMHILKKLIVFLEHATLLEGVPRWHHIILRAAEDRWVGGMRLWKMQRCSGHSLRGTSAAVSPWRRTDGQAPPCHHAVVRRDQCRRVIMESYTQTSVAVSACSRTRGPAPQCHHGIVRTRGVFYKRKSGNDSAQCRGLGNNNFGAGEAART